LRGILKEKIIEEKPYLVLFQFNLITSQKPALLGGANKRCINESVKTHLVSDVPFGAFLFGGVDFIFSGWQIWQLDGSTLSKL